MEGASSSIPRESDENEGQSGLNVIQGVDGCLGEVEFDLIVRPFGCRCEGCDGRSAPVITLSTKEGPGFADPRDMKGLMAKIGERMRTDGCSRIGVCGMESLFYWNDALQVREFLVGIDGEMRKSGAKGCLMLREELLSNSDVQMIKEILS